ncbi:DUF4937 domain-containing protein [Halobacillus sp. A5]|uniref:DUF4937 domain-containing protein n=1 Tax=Halobacillus sp. A5 TaxID=2880263 RepID=UPI0020A6BA96|nr:DUF4937 domain-containing protein [Halobacillus sp. A5]MCP3029478.1 YdbC family protein [Halobacillus sp. A5]
MLIKRICCSLKEGKKQTFSQQQKQWNTLCKMDGFLGQIGGFSINEPKTAWIYSFWNKEEDYRKFMAEIHDTIADHSGQANSYTTIEVALFQLKSKVVGSEKEIAHMIRRAAYIRTAFSKVKEQRIDQFIEKQQTVWNTGMQRSDGIIGGLFAQSNKLSNEYMVVTGWESEKHHQEYVDEHFPELLKQAKTGEDVLELSGDQFKVEESWRIYPEIDIGIREQRT